ncbi:hypothetical protein ACHAL6_01075 [Proteiniclasticum sp. C24MP]|uniref:hypothetical protein n=1 Tax=Proteiniclasticum sp. C24MP TaxID=3374101 RepID=UPI0037546C18
MKRSKDNLNKEAKQKGVSYLAIGIGLGVALGAAMNNLAVGIALGVAIGAGLDQQGREKNKDK